MTLLKTVLILIGVCLAIDVIGRRYLLPALRRWLLREVEAQIAAKLAGALEGSGPESDLDPHTRLMRDYHTDYAKKYRALVARRAYLHHRLNPPRVTATLVFDDDGKVIELNRSRDRGDA